ncbi:ArsR family transcriptional regulator [Microlunatus phosphovorus NM-1]|uniref:ArsR family transcriptional regulator n=1 Tax=Microlunatus phosphovorus (strain ATCC 700054 / DSM 10555 / JCM 9379 / NBRC 101784 / NCIMB 13414 / VKM Ac-1990 / NM-1) TaxID=1032480 RepID=F5XIN1_MICPN|nr:metalloregulator ArsR/SmtB family transcription factor [Microlunatus phosphovorus]BAK38269.1 ArsR family transcriptional regulator [Microlunatus phosphovorus NM-1]
MRADNQRDRVEVAGPVDAQFVELAVEVFSMLADPTRVRIVLALQGGELPVNTIATAVDKAPASVSQHLAKLRLARIVASRQDGNRVFYRLANEHAAQLVTDAIHQAEHALGQPRHHRRDTT